jgi:DNA-binding transcriptional MerR regulator
MDKLPSISDLAETFGLSMRTLRFWEQKGLVKPVARESNRRVYTQVEAAHVGVLVRLRKCLFPLDTMKEWRGASDEVKRKLLLQQFSDNAKSIADLTVAQIEIEKMIDELDG